MPDVVDAELDFVAFGCEGGWRQGDPGIVVEDVETLGLGGDGVCGGLCAFEGCQVEFDGDDAGVWVGAFDLCDEGFCAGRVAGAEVDC